MTWNREKGTHTKFCIVEGCDAEAAYPRRICRKHRNEQELARRKERIEANVGKPCIIDGCDNPRYASKTQVTSVCQMHHNERSLAYQRSARQEDHEPRRAQPTDPEAIRAQSRLSAQKHRRRQMYGVDYEAEYAKQQGRCANTVCRVELPVLEVDHCHSTLHPEHHADAYRGLLCKPCNLLLSRGGDSAKHLDAYLKEQTDPERIRLVAGLLAYAHVHDSAFHSPLG